MRSTIIPLAGLSLLLAGGAVIAQDAEQEAKITYTPVFADALSSAKEQKQPIMVVVVAGEDEERTNFIALLDSEKVKKLSAHFQVVLAAEGTHGGSEDGKCSAFDGVTCDEHDAAYRSSRRSSSSAPAGCRSSCF
jgi:hypothetical protein